MKLDIKERILKIIIIINLFIQFVYIFFLNVFKCVSSFSLKRLCSCEVKKRMWSWCLVESYEKLVYWWVFFWRGLNCIRKCSIFFNSLHFNFFLLFRWKSTNGQWRWMWVFFKKNYIMCIMNSFHPLACPENVYTDPCTGVDLAGKLGKYL